jgi:hypothetical protein
MIQFGVLTLLVEKLGTRTLFSDLTLSKHHDLIGKPCRIDSMRDNHGGLTLTYIHELAEDLSLHKWVQ